MTVPVQPASKIATVKVTVKSIGVNIITWQWTRQFLHWAVLSAGTVSECAFLVASLWMSINSSVHNFVLAFLPEQATQRVTELATAAYVALPEMILGLAAVTTISHIRTWWYDKKRFGSMAWTVLFGIPTIVFLVLSIVTLASSVLSTTFLLPEPLVVARALAGYMYAFVSLLYTQLGKPQEVDRLREKDDLIVQLKKEKDDQLAELWREHEGNLTELRANFKKQMADLQLENNRLQVSLKQQNEELARQNGLLEQTKKVQREMEEALNKSADDALGAYSAECKVWLKSGLKSVSIDAISEYTGHSKRKIQGAINSGYLQTTSRNKELILVWCLN